MLITIPLTVSIQPDQEKCNPGELLSRLAEDDFAKGLSHDLSEYLYEWLNNEEGFVISALGIDVGYPVEKPEDKPSA